MFVDDKDVWMESSAAGSNNEKDALMKYFRRAAQAWDRILPASGGLLALHKCYCWTVSWKWNKDTPDILK